MHCKSAFPLLHTELPNVKFLFLEHRYFSRAPSRHIIDQTFNHCFFKKILCNLAYVPFLIINYYFKCYLMFSLKTKTKFVMFIRFCKMSSNIYLCMIISNISSHIKHPNKLVSRQWIPKLILLMIVYLYICRFITIKFLLSLNKLLVYMLFVNYKLLFHLKIIKVVCVQEKNYREQTANARRIDLIMDDENGLLSY